MSGEFNELTRSDDDFGAVGLERDGPEVTESARAHSYYSISTGTQTATPPGCTIFDPRVTKCLIVSYAGYTFSGVPKVYSTLYIVSNSVLYI